jgi:DnaJ-class molecular chaperone
MTSKPSYYDILGLPSALQNDPHLPAQTLRGAYRRALLQNHPDKSIQTLNSTSKLTTYSIDQITEAFSVLSDKKTRAAYDKDSKLQAAAKNGRSEGTQIFRTGVETVDLDDLIVEEEQGIWYRGCRCGDEQGFLIREQDLEEAADEGEISVGCRGCSLWLKVLFHVMAEGEEGDNGLMEARIVSDTPS